jgi:hypothetical protein
MSNLKRGNWSTHDLERLRALYPKSAEEHVARLLRRSVESVNRKAREIFDGANRADRPWTAEDDLQLRQGFGVVDRQVLSLVLGRALQEIDARIVHLGRELKTGDWSRMDCGLLKKLYGSRADEDLVVCLSRPLVDIQRMAAELCLSKDKGFLARSEDRSRQMPRWQPAEIELLESLYHCTSNLDLARRLDRSVASVANKANQLGLRKDPAVLEEMGRRNVATRYRTHQG